MSGECVNPPPGEPWKLPGYDAKADDCNSYGYVPTLWQQAFFLTIFATLTIAHGWQVWMSRRWWLLVMVAGGIGETAGWAGRLYNHFELYQDDFYMMQLVCLIICPSFFSAAVFAIAGWVITAIDASLSPLRPQLYWKVFVTADVISLVIQSIGGGLAASAEDEKTSDLGSNIMLAGIIFQLVIVLAFSGLFAHFLWNVYKRDLRPTRNLQYLTLGNIIATVVIIVRGIYRVVELAEGWGGHLITTEVYFLLDAIPMAICMLVLSVVHPLWTLRLPAKTLPHGTPLAKASQLSGHVPLDSNASGFPITHQHREMEQV